MSKFETNPLYQITESGLAHLCKKSKFELQKIVKEGYKHYSVNKKDKKRCIDEPNDDLKASLKTLTKSLQKLPCPDYCKCGWPKQNSFLNAIVHAKNPAKVTMDITDYYSNTSSKLIRNLFENKFKIKGQVLDLLVEMTTCNGYLPTGSPTSSILAFLAHQELFDEITREMNRRDIVFTIYADDITLSAKYGITRAEIRYIQSILDKHKLKLKNKKTKFYNYKKALITGYYIDQNGKMSVPYSIGHKVIKKLKTTPINDMDITQVRSLLASIGYQRYVDQKAFSAIRIKAIKQLKKLEKLQEK